MNGIKKATLSLALLAIFAFFAATASADFLGTAYDDGINDPWEGSTNFEEGDLEGTVEWIVYAPGEFPAEYTGFAPTAGQLTYVYQVSCAGSDNITSYEVYLSNEAGVYGSFSGGGISGASPSSMVLNPLNSMVWNFAGITNGNSSVGLAYCSPNTPQDYESYANDGGNTAYVYPVPSPSSSPIPEPAAIWSLMMAMVTLAMWRLRRR